MRFLAQRAVLMASMASTAVLLAGCYESPLRVTVDGERQEFNRGVRTVAFATNNGGYQLSITGSHDPQPGTVDDERSLALRVDFDPAVIAQLPRDVPLTIRGTTQFPAINGDNQGGYPEDSQITFTAEEGHRAGIRRVSLMQSCFCFRTGGETQRWTGTITISTASPGQLRFDLDLGMEGTIPFRGTLGTPVRNAHISGTVEAPASP